MPDQPAVPSGPARPQLGFLHGLRGLAALYVVLFHFTSNCPGYENWSGNGRALAAFFRHGYLAVDVFIVLSGFLLMMPVVLNGGAMPGGTGRFLLRRTVRIVPPYIAAYLAFLVFWKGLISLVSYLAPSHDVGLLAQMRKAYEWDNIAAHLLLIHPFHPDWSGVPTGIFWSVGVEWHIYFLFALLLVPLWRVAGTLTSVAAAFLVGLLPVYVFPSFYYTFPWMVCQFGLGMAGAVVAFSDRSAWRKLYWKLPWGIVAALLSVILILLLRIRPYYYHAGPPASYWWLDALAGLATVSLILYLLRGSTPRRDAPETGKRRSSLLQALLDSRPVSALGQFSYSLYLTHGMVVLAARALLKLTEWPVGVTAAVMLGIGVPLSLGCAYLFYLVFELPTIPRKPPPVLTPAMTGAVGDSVNTTSEPGKDVCWRPARIVNFHRDTLALGILYLLLFLIFFRPWSTQASPDPLSMGSMLLWSPFTAVARSAPATMAAAGFGTLFYGALTLGLVYATLRLLFHRVPSVLGAVTAVLSGPLLAYLELAPVTVYAPSAFACSLLLYLLLRLRKQWAGREAQVLVGLAMGLVVLVRWQDAVWGAFVVALWGCEWTKGRRASNGARWWNIVAGVGVGVALSGLVLFLGPTGPAEEIARMNWSRPQLWGVLFSGYHGLFYLHPWLLAGPVGLVGVAVVSRGRLRVLALSGLLVMALSVYVNACVPEWWTGPSFGGKRFCSLLPLFGLGVAGLAEGARRVGRQTYAVAVTGLCAVAGANVVLLALFDRGLLEVYGLHELWYLRQSVAGTIAQVMVCLPLNGHVGSRLILLSERSYALGFALLGGGLVAAVWRLLVFIQRFPRNLLARPAVRFAAATPVLGLLVWEASVDHDSRLLRNPSLQDPARFPVATGLQVCTRQIKASATRNDADQELLWQQRLALIAPFDATVLAAWNERYALTKKDHAEWFAAQRASVLESRIRTRAYAYRGADSVQKAEHGVAIAKAAAPLIDDYESQGRVRKFRELAGMIPVEVAAEMGLPRRVLAMESLKHKAAASGRPGTPRELLGQADARAADFLMAAAKWDSMRETTRSLATLRAGLHRFPSDDSLARRFARALEQPEVDHTLLVQLADFETTSTRFWTLLGEAEFRNGRYRKAERYLRRAEQAASDDPRVKRVLVLIRQAQSRDPRHSPPGVATGH